jgi:hypothetical protein
VTSHALGSISVYVRGTQGDVYALACHRCDRLRPSTATLMRSQVPAKEWPAAVWGFLLEHLHGHTVALNGDVPLPFPRDAG